MIRVKLDSSLQLARALRKVQNLKPYNFGKSGTKGKGKHTGLGFQPERGEQKRYGGYCNWCWRIGHKESQSWLKQEYTKNNPPQDPLQTDIREWSNPEEKGQGHQPKGYQDQAGSPDEKTGQRRLDDFGIKRQRDEFVVDVQVSDDFETPKVDRAAYSSF